jgi:hypothetical protein
MSTATAIRIAGDAGIEARVAACDWLRLSTDLDAQGIDAAEPLPRLERAVAGLVASSGRDPTLHRLSATIADRLRVILKLFRSGDSGGSRTGSTSAMACACRFGHARQRMFFAFARVISVLKNPSMRAPTPTAKARSAPASAWHPIALSSPAPR